LDTYLQQDLVENSEALVNRVRAMIGEGIEVLRDVYAEFRDFTPDQDALASLRGEQAKRFAFRHFL